jgi:chaperone modulatory protein CbpM
MIISKLDLIYRAQIDQETLALCIEEQWLLPLGSDPEPVFTEADVARAQLILDLKRDMGVNNEGIGVILDLLDQLHSLRKALAGRRTTIENGA